MRGDFAKQAAGFGLIRTSARWARPVASVQNPLKVSMSPAICAIAETKALMWAILHHEGRRDLQDHEIVSADLVQHAMVAEQAHDQDLAENRRVDRGQRLERNPQLERAWRLEFDGVQKPEPANLAEHFITRKPLPQSIAKALALFAVGCPSRSSSSPLKVASPARMARPSRGRSRCEPGGVERAVDGLVDSIGHQYGAAWKFAADGLGKDDDIGGRAKMVTGQKWPGAEEPGLNFVQNEKRAVAAAKRLNFQK